MKTEVSKNRSRTGNEFSERKFLSERSGEWNEYYGNGLRNLLRINQNAEQTCAWFPSAWAYILAIIGCFMVFQDSSVKNYNWKSLAVIIIIFYSRFFSAIDLWPKDLKATYNIFLTNEFFLFKFMAITWLVGLCIFGPRFVGWTVKFRIWIRLLSYVQMNNHWNRLSRNLRLTRLSLFFTMNRKKIISETANPK